MGNAYGHDKKDHAHQHKVEISQEVSQTLKNYVVQSNKIGDIDVDLGGHFVHSTLKLYVDLTQANTNDVTAKQTVSGTVETKHGTYQLEQDVAQTLYNTVIQSNEIGDIDIDLGGHFVHSTILIDFDLNQSNSNIVEVTQAVW